MTTPILVLTATTALLLFGKMFAGNPTLTDDEGKGNNLLIIYPINIFQ